MAQAIGTHYRCPKCGDWPAVDKRQKPYWDGKKLCCDRLLGVDRKGRRYYCRQPVQIIELPRQKGPKHGD